MVTSQYLVLLTNKQNISFSSVYFTLAVTTFFQSC